MTLAKNCKQEQTITSITTILIHFEFSSRSLSNSSYSSWAQMWAVLDPRPVRWRGSLLPVGRFLALDDLRCFLLWVVGKTPADRVVVISPVTLIPSIEERGGKRVDLLTWNGERVKTTQIKEITIFDYLLADIEMIITCYTRELWFQS